MTSWSYSAPTPRRFAPGCGSTRARADAGTLGLDEFGRRVLGVGGGDAVVLRRVAQPRPPGGMAHPSA